MFSIYQSIDDGDFFAVDFSKLHHKHAEFNRVLLYIYASIDKGILQEISQLMLISRIEHTSGAVCVSDEILQVTMGHLAQHAILHVFSISSMLRH